HSRAPRIPLRTESELGVRKSSGWGRDYSCQHSIEDSDGDERRTVFCGLIPAASAALHSSASGDPRELRSNRTGRGGGQCIAQRMRRCHPIRILQFKSPPSLPEVEHDAFKLPSGDSQNALKVIVRRCIRHESDAVGEIRPSNADFVQLDFFEIRLTGQIGKLDLPKVPPTHSSGHLFCKQDEARSTCVYH